MSAFVELLRGRPARAERHAIPVRAAADVDAAPLPVPSLRDEQIHVLVQELFFGRESAKIRNVGFAPVEASSQTAPLCFDVAKALAGEGRCDVGLIDCSAGSPPLQQQLQIPVPANEEVAPVGPKLWLVPRTSWFPDAGDRRPATDRNLERLRELMTEFDFSLLCCGPTIWLNTTIARICNGLVLVLTAGKTRRLVAQQIKDQLAKSQVSVLGSVLLERRFPVPQSLYRSL